MDQAALRVRVEREGERPVALVVNGGELATSLTGLLEQQGMEVIWSGESELQEQVRTPRFIFFFGQDRGGVERQLKLVIDLASRSGAKLIVVWDHLAAQRQRELEEVVKESNGWPVTIVELQGEGSKRTEEKIEVMGKVVRVAFSSGNEKRVVVGEPGQVPDGRPAKEWGVLALDQGMGREMVRGEKRWRRLGLRIGLGVLLVVLPFIILGVIAGLGVVELGRMGIGLKSGDYRAGGEAARRAQRYWSLTSEGVWLISRPFETVGMGALLEKPARLAVLGEVMADSGGRVAEMGPEVLAVGKAFLGEDYEGDLGELSERMQVEMAAMDRNLGILEAELGSRDWDGLVSWGETFGYPREEIRKQIAGLGWYRKVLSQGERVLGILPDLVGEKQQRTYLVVFQNSAELRPTGGFIGSYATVRFDQGRMLDYKINDIYTADGQMKGQVAPPDEILHYLGQPNWYMRDANFAADFPLSAKRLLWFLEKETGQSVDGVVAVNLGAVQKILSAVGPVEIEGAGKITGENFFEKAEYASEINFFPGSTQKRDFLGEVANGILRKLGSSETEWTGLAAAVTLALREKDVMFYSNSAAEQKVFEANGWAGSIDQDFCRTAGGNCFSLVEAHFGANKANYFVKERIRGEIMVDKGGKVAQEVTVEFKNESPSESWPGGKYKNYLRFLIPERAVVETVDLGDGRVASFSAVLTANVLSKIDRGHFLVFDSKELALNNEGATRSAFRSLGMLVEVPAGGSRKVRIKYWPGYTVDFSSERPEFLWGIIKQPGAPEQSWTMAVDHPSFLAAVGSDEAAGLVVSEQRIEYNGKLESDKVFRVRFRQK